MTIKDKLHMMKQIDEDNRNHVEEWKRKNMKIWVINYGFIDRDGVKHVWDVDKTGFDSHSDNFTYQVEAMDIQEALNKGKEQIAAKAFNRYWQYWTIIDVGICNNNIW